MSSAFLRAINVARDTQQIMLLDDLSRGRASSNQPKIDPDISAYQTELSATQLTRDKPFSPPHPLNTPCSSEAISCHLEWIEMPRNGVDGHRSTADYNAL